VQANVPSGRQQVGGSPDIRLPSQQLLGPLFSGEQPTPDISSLPQRPDNSYVNSCRTDGSMRGAGKAGDPLLPVFESSSDYRS
jgi:hypothetical protein